jgi:hypothetical protein
MKYNPEYSMMFWNLENFPYMAVDALTTRLLNSNLCFITKAEIMKYNVIRIFGGIYADTDMECLKSFDPLMGVGSFAGRSYAPDNICNALMATDPCNPVFEEVCNIISQSVYDEWDGANDQRYLLDIKGGMHQVGKIIESGVERLLPVETFFPFHWDTPKEKRSWSSETSYAVHHWNGKEKDGWLNVDFTNCKERNFN